MIIKANDIKATGVHDIIDELYNNQNVMDHIRGMNLRGGDAIEAMAINIADDNDIELNDYNHIS